ncbi:hypothetical protein DRQ50_10345, partial [bacterium]
MRPRSNNFVSRASVITAVTAVTLLPLVLSQAGFGFQAPAHSTGWATDSLRLQFDVVTLAVVLFIGIAAQVHRRIEARRGVLLLGMALVLAGLANGIHLVPDRPDGVTHAAILSRAATTAVMLAALLVLDRARGGRDRKWLGIMFAVITPLAVPVWIIPTVFGPGPLPHAPGILGAGALALQLLAAIQTLRLVRQGRLRFLGRGLLLGFIPMIGGQIALLAHLAGLSADGAAVAVLLQWFAWTLP